MSKVVFISEKILVLGIKLFTANKQSQLIHY